MLTITVLFGESRALCIIKEKKGENYVYLWKKYSTYISPKEIVSSYAVLDLMY